MPVFAEFDRRNAARRPAVYPGSAYDGSLVLGGNAESFGFLQTLAGGESVTFTDLLATCFPEIDAEIGRLPTDTMKKTPPHRDQVEAVENCCWLLRVTCWRYLMTDEERTMFCWAFYNSEYYTYTVMRWQLTKIPKNTPISARTHYLRGQGQRYEKCYYKLYKQGILSDRKTADG